MDQPVRKTFDVISQEMLRKLAQDVIGQVPEISSILCIVHYEGQFDQSPGIKYGVLVGRGPNGQVTSAEEVFGALAQAVRVSQDSLLERASAIVQGLQDEAVRVGKEVAELYRKKAELEKATQASPAGEPDPPRDPGDFPG